MGEDISHHPQLASVKTSGQSSLLQKSRPVTQCKPMSHISLPPRVLNLYYFNDFIEIPIEEYLMRCHSLKDTSIPSMPQMPNGCRNRQTPNRSTRILAGKEFLRCKVSSSRLPIGPACKPYFSRYNSHKNAEHLRN